MAEVILEKKIDNGGLVGIIHGDAVSNSWESIYKNNNGNPDKSCGVIIGNTDVYYYDAQSIRHLMPSITDVNVICRDDNTPKVVIVTFSDGEKEKAVLDDKDSFSLEQGISICITKKLLSQRCDGHGHSVYNRLVKYGVKAFYNKLKEEDKAREQHDIEKARIARLAEKKRRKRAKREAAEEARYIELESKAILKALEEYDKTAKE